ncbi:hypothetical protein DIPPA_21084 [Diplonema papillatum]|nr:hypothetical protein DIPPA_21084 [Diplonema papillatum]
MDRRDAPGILVACSMTCSSVACASRDVETSPRCLHAFPKAAAAPWRAARWLRMSSGQHFVWASAIGDMEATSIPSSSSFNARSTSSSVNSEPSPAPSSRSCTFFAHSFTTFSSSSRT